MLVKNLYLLPILPGALTLATFTITYAIAVYQNHVLSFMPYVSDTGTFPPESCLFAQSINVSAALLIAFFWIRYMQVRNFCDGEFGYTRYRKINRISFWLGITCAAFSTLLANFQLTNVFMVHIGATGIAMSAGMWYTLLQTYLCHSLDLCSRRLALVRMIIVTFTAINFLMVMLTAPTAYFYFDGPNLQKWKPEDGGYTLHLISAFGEWLCIPAFFIFIMTFAKEFHSLRLQFPELNVIQESTKQHMEENKLIGYSSEPSNGSEKTTKTGSQLSTSQNTNGDSHC